MQIQAYLSSGQHPECGAVHVAFPIPEQKYDNILDLLRSMGVGDAVQRDCQLTELSSGYSALKCLNGQTVNLDELDYLAKRLDSFDKNEAAQFEATLSNLGLTEMTDIINLTFCCQQATVITDFSDLEKVGKTHFLTVQGGCAPKDELDALDGYETALLLIDSGAGVVTPYGVLYDNGMKLEQIYDGRNFPVYYHDNYEASMIVAPADEPKRETLIYFPCADSKIERTMQRLGVSDLSDCVAVQRDTPTRSVVAALLDFDYDWEQDLNALNQLMRCCKNFTDEKISLLNAVIEEVRPQTPHEAVSLAKNFEDIAALPGITRPDLYGQHILEIEEWQNIDPALQECVDVQLYGEIRAKQEHGQFSSWGYVGYRGDDPVVQEVFARWAQSEEQSEQPDQGPQMGGMV